MRIERNWNKRYSMQNRLKYEIQYIFRSAKKEKSTFETILKSIGERIYNSHTYKKIGEIGRANVNGHVEAHFNVHQDELDWSCWYAGVFMGLTKKFQYSAEFNSSLLETGYVYKGTEIRYNQNQKTKEN